MSIRTDDRWRAFHEVRAWHPRWGLDNVLSTAARLVAFIEAPTVVRIRVGLVCKQVDGSVSPTQPRGRTMQLHDDEQVSYALDTVDAKGQARTGENFAAVSSDETVLTLTQDGDTFTAVAGLPGSAVVTFTDAESGLSATEAIDVIPGDAVAVTVTAGEISKQPAAPVG